MSIKYLIGCDPELFIQNDKGHFISAHDIIPGSKDSPVEVLSGAIQPDGTAAEFNIHPAETAEEFSENIRDVLTELTSRIHQFDPKLKLVVSPTATFVPIYFNKLPPSAKALGCQPDFNAYTCSHNPMPATKKPFRTGAGHIHAGWTSGAGLNDEAHFFDCIEATKQLDQVLYPLSLLWDDDNTRRTLYGKLGAFRPKPYGVEYRPLSNAWVADPDLHLWVFKATKHALELIDQDMPLEKDYFCKSMIDQIRNETQPSRTELLEYHDYLVTEFHVPQMPEPYIRIVN